MSIRKRIKLWPMYTLVVAFAFCGVLFTYAYLQSDSVVLPVKVDPVVAVPQTPPPVQVAASLLGATETYTETDSWETIYPDTKVMKIGSLSVNASIAKSWPERIRGLSGTPYLPFEVVKLFVFDTPGQHSIWMKDMNYAIDIIWVDAAGVIVDKKENVSPDTYPASFEPVAPALYIIEAQAGFLEKAKVTIGDKVSLPDFTN
jgi:uncharacterized protein